MNTKEILLMKALCARKMRKHKTPDAGKSIVTSDITQSANLQQLTVVLLFR